MMTKRKPARKTRRKPGKPRCYVLRSEHPEYPTKGYPGFTRYPYQRLRQHNGELVKGAKKTSYARPWKMVALLENFDSEHDALSFEWRMFKDKIGRCPSGIPKDDVRRCPVVRRMLRLVNEEPRWKDIVIQWFPTRQLLQEIEKRDQQQQQELTIQPSVDITV
jgi:predicted GIY-YIG superfamily endonuclease